MSAIHQFFDRKFDHHGYATRIEFAGTWLFGFLITFIYLAPLLGYGYYQLYYEYYDDLIYTYADPLEIISDPVWIALMLWCFVCSVVGMAYFIIMMMTTVRRLRHIGWSPWHTLWAAIPIVNIVFLFVLFFMPGRNLENKIEDTRKEDETNS